jgi:hypothetical protein
LIGDQGDGVFKSALITARKKSFYANFVSDDIGDGMGTDRTMPFHVPTINIDGFHFHDIWNYMKWLLTIRKDRANRNITSPTISPQESSSGITIPDYVDMGIGYFKVEGVKESGVRLYYNSNDSVYKLEKINKDPNRRVTETITKPYRVYRKK